MAKGRNHKAEYARRKALASVKASEAKRGGTYTKAYRERLIRNLQKGKTRQEARGHEAREHVTRREREIEKRGITNDQAKIVVRWADKRFWTVKDLDDPEYIQHVLDWSMDNGYEAFKEYREFYDRERREYLARGRTIQNTIGYLTAASESLSLENVSWLYYH